MYVEPNHAVGELVPKIFIETKDSGKYFIPQHRLVALSPDEAERAELAIVKLAEENPLYDFTSEEDMFNFGILIRWRKRR